MREHGKKYTNAAKNLRHRVDFIRPSKDADIVKKSAFAKVLMNGGISPAMGGRFPFNGPDQGRARDRRVCRPNREIGARFAGDAGGRKARRGAGSRRRISFGVSTLPEITGMAGIDFELAFIATPPNQIGQLGRARNALPQSRAVFMPNPKVRGTVTFQRRQRGLRETKARPRSSYAFRQGGQLHAPIGKVSFRRRKRWRRIHRPFMDQIIRSSPRRRRASTVKKRLGLSTMGPTDDRPNPYRG